MNKIGIFFGSDTGNTENIARKIYKKLGGEKTADIFDIAKSDKNDIEKYDKLIFGIPTWYYGEAQCDWDDFFVTLKKIDFSNKLVSIFGCGDQEDYSEYFCDAMGTLYDLIKLQGANLIGKWSTVGYNFESSKSLINKDYFIGLAIDEDRQPELTDERVNTWIKQLFNEFKLN